MNKLITYGKNNGYIFHYVYDLNNVLDRPSVHFETKLRYERMIYRNSACTTAVCCSSIL